MHATMNRRHWLTSTALAAASLTLTRQRARAAGGSPSGRAIKLDQNENPFGISSKMEEAIIAAARSSNRYPMRELGALRDLIAEREKVTGDHVILGSGCTEILSLACQRFGAEGREVLVAEPTYSGFVGCVESLRGKPIKVPVNNRWELDLDAMAQRATPHTGLVYVCNPNNPTGTLVDSARLRSFCEDLAGRGLVLVDEAYYELVEEARRASMIELVRKGVNVLVARTFSKVFGLAGLRVGYGLAKPDVIAELRRLQSNFCPVNRLGLAAALAACADENHIVAMRGRITEARAGFYRLLEELGHKPIPGSQANFVTFEAKVGSRRMISTLKQDFQIAVRPFQFLGKEWVRVSMGTPEEMAALATALRQIG